MVVGDGCMVKANLGLCSLFKVEILRAVGYILGFFKVELEMDLGVLVNAIKASSSSLVCEPLFKELNLLPGKDWEVRVSHNYRDGNRSEDWLASAGFSTCFGVALPRFCRL
ncbi:hypothetical protein OIU79_005001 [Salix purpurea]|uniref:RNase H type-1 domain-containing protein n=1 Tax=Salix purpurea TaxID=77065 RepID=A0A9Q0UBP5_SALPP|nr:hypothetical protein OIU79_005001 [Salix purpurea]